jgi:glycosyltransferase involved in cell wall biosynthesis
MYVGRMLYWKGMHLGLPAFARFHQSYPDARLTMIGDGPDEEHWRKIAQAQGIADCTEWIGRVKLNELFDLYRHHDVLLYPTLHDSGGMQIPEALALGLSVICLDVGGTEIVNDSCGRAVETAGRSRAEVVEAMASALAELAGDRALRQQLSEGAFRRSEAMCWRNLVKRANPDLFEAGA